MYDSTQLLVFLLKLAFKPYSRIFAMEESEEFVWRSVWSTYYVCCGCTSIKLWNNLYLLRCKSSFACCRLESNWHVSFESLKNHLKYRNIGHTHSLFRKESHHEWLLAPFDALQFSKFKYDKCWLFLIEWRTFVDMTRWRWGFRRSWVFVKRLLKR